MRDYAGGLPVSYNLGLHDFGSGGDALAIPVPGGFTKGRIREIAVSATETFTAVTTPGYVRIGTGADPDKFAELSLGTTADTDAVSAAAQDGAMKDGDGLGPGVFNADGLTQLEVALVAPTGGTPAGIGHVNVAIEWF